MTEELPDIPLEDDASSSPKRLWRAVHVHIFLVSFVLTVAGAIGWGVFRFVNATEARNRDLLTLSAILQSTTPDSEGPTIAQAIRQGDPDILAADFVSKEQALEKAQKDPSLAKSLMLLKENPLPGVVTLRLSDKAWLERADPAQGMNAFPQIQEARFNAQARSVFRSAHFWKHWLLSVGIVLAVGLMGWFIVGLAQHFGSSRTVGEVVMGLLVGGLGSATALGALFFSLQKAGSELLVYPPPLQSLLLVFTGIIVGVALSGLNRRHAD